MAQTKPDLSRPADIRLRPGLTAWVLTDGKAGDENQCLAVAERLGLAADRRCVRPRPPFTWLMPWGPIDPREAPQRAGSPIGPPWPDLVIASGRRAVPYLREVRRGSGGQSFTVYLKDPRTGPGTADLIWAPSYDPIRGPNVVSTLTSPHRISPERLTAARRDPDPRLAGLPGARVAVLVGGDSRHGRFAPAESRRLVEHLDSLAATGASLMITGSRRTPTPLAEELRALVARRGGFFWDGTGENPYLPMLALAEAVVVTGDSVNMISEAVATGAPVLLFELAPRGARHQVLIAELTRLGAVRPFQGKLERFGYPPLDSTPVIAEAVARGVAAHRAALDSLIRR
jgi:hypothetical protein